MIIKKYLSKCITVIRLTIITILATSLSSYAQSNQTINTQDDEFNLFLFTFLMVFVSFLIGITIVGILATLLMLLIIATLIGLGILSTSVIIGINTKSFKKGFQSFISISICSICSFVGLIGFYPICKLFNYTIAISNALLIGGGIGLSAGLIISWLFKKLSLIIINKLLPKK